MKKNIINISILSVLLINFVATICLIFGGKEKSELNVYNECLNSVVEIKSDKQGVGTSYGTAVCVGKNIFITNAHVLSYSIAGESELFDAFSIRKNGENGYHNVQLIKYDVEQDLALLSIDLDNYCKPISFGSIDNINVGDKVYSIGNMNNYGISFCLGYISIPRLILKDDLYERKAIQSNLTISEGNSGGALVDEKGKLIGITSFRVKDNKGNPIYGIAYSIPIDVVIDFTSN